MSPSQQPKTINPTHLKNQFAHRFIRALNTLNNTPHDNQAYRRSHRVKIAAYTAMASVVGSRRAWSRAVLWKIRNRSRNQGRRLLSIKKRFDHKITNHHQPHHAKRRNRKHKREDVDFNRIGHSGQESRLRKLVPGAESMDSLCLMDETADYIKCLAVQVEVMKTLLNLYTTT